MKLLALLANKNQLIYPLIKILPKQSTSLSNNTKLMKLLVFFTLLLTTQALPENPYDRLGIYRDSDIKDVKKAFRRLSLNYHPDKRPSDNHTYQTIVAAYEEILEDKQRDEDYQNYKNQSQRVEKINWSFPYIYTKKGLSFQTLCDNWILGTGIIFTLGVQIIMLLKYSKSRS